MELTKKQIILIVVLSGLVLLLTVAAILIFTPGDEETPVEPTASPQATASPTVEPTPPATPTPTVFRLPLVPQRDTPQPGSKTPETGVFAPREPQREGEEDPWAGADDGQSKNILAVGLQDGRAAALLLMGLSRDVLTILSLPPEDTVGIGSGEEAAARVETVTGRRVKGWLALDIDCLPDVLQITGPLSSREFMTSIEGPRQAEDALELAMGAVAYLQRAPLLRFLALKRAVGDAFTSNLSTRELWRLLWTVRGGVSVQGRLLPVGQANEA